MRPERIKDTLEVILQKLHSQGKNKEEALSDILMSQLAPEERAHVQPWSLRKGVFTLHIDSPGWMYALNLKKAQLLKELQARTNRETIKDIRLRIGRVK